jgi:hypothetical protein
VRVWDVSPGYLNRESLLGEHRELHGLYSILVHGKKGYSRHPETLRWVACRSGLIRRHALLVAEMRLRGYMDRTPLPDRRREARWPSVFVTPPSMQFVLLGSKYRHRRPGRIPLPKSVQELWAQHKYSVMARDQRAYRALGRRVARAGRTDFPPLADELVTILRAAPPPGELVNALEHMWGHVSKAATADDRIDAQRSPACMMLKIQELAIRLEEPYLAQATALADLAVFA